MMKAEALPVTKSCKMLARNTVDIKFPLLSLHLDRVDDIGYLREHIIKDAA